MPNPSGPDRDDPPPPPEFDPAAQPDAAFGPPADDAEAATEVFPTEAGAVADAAQPKPAERRFTAPGFDASQTEIIEPLPEPATEVIPTPGQQPPRKAAPQSIPPRLAQKPPSGASRSWGWVVALILTILALAAIAVLGTVWLTHSDTPKVSQEDQVRETIHKFDIAVHNGDLATLRSITCGSFRDNYVNYTEQAWSDTYHRVLAAKRIPVIASIDQVVVNDDHAEANVTAFMTHAPQVRSTRSLDLQYRDNQWKVCQAPTG